MTDKIIDSRQLDSQVVLRAINAMQHCITKFEDLSASSKAAGEALLKLNEALWDAADENQRMRALMAEYEDAREAYEALTRPRSGFARARVTAFDHPAAVRFREARKAMQAFRRLRSHDLWKTGEEGIPPSITDRNGVVILGLCKACGKAKAELLDNEGHCNGAPKGSNNED